MTRNQFPGAGARVPLGARVSLGAGIPLGAGATVAWAVLCCACGSLFFYRDIIWSGFDRVFGDDGDARLAMLLMEHWFRVLSGKAAFFSPIFFYPTAGVIGFTDGNFLYGLVYSACRAMGASLYGAFQSVVIVWGVLGFGSMVWLLRRVFGCHLVVCLVWAWLFAFSNLNAIQVGHMQLLVVATLPVLVGCLVLLWRGLAQAGRLRLAVGGVLVLLYPTMAFTGFYVCWFFALYLATVLLVGCAVDRGAMLRPVLRAAWLNRWRIAALAAVGVLFSLPFVAAYGPQLVGNNGFTVDPLFLSTFPHPRDLIDLGSDNLVWGRFLLWLTPDLFSRLGGYELAMGMPPGFLALFAIATVAAIRGAQRDGSKLPAILAVGVWVGLLLILNLHGHSAWWAVRSLVPGARSIRVVSRYQVVLYAMALIASAPVVSLWVARALAGRRLGAAVAVAAGAFLLLEQVQPTFARVSKSADLARLDRIPPPPSSCRFFVLTPMVSSGDHDAFVRREQVDAIYQAMRFGLPTINGLSSLNPPGYFFYDLSGPDYALDAGMWMARYGLTDGACTLDQEHAVWGKLSPDPAPLVTGANILALSPEQKGFAIGMRFAAIGFAGPIPTPWTGRNSAWRFVPPLGSSTVTLRYAVTNPKGTDVVISINGTPLDRRHVASGNVEFVHRVDGPITEISIEATTFRPSAISASPDTRDLGVLVTWLSFTP